MLLVVPPEVSEGGSSWSSRSRAFRSLIAAHGFGFRFRVGAFRFHGFRANGYGFIRNLQDLRLKGSESRTRLR